MRLILPVLLLALSACDRDSELADRQAARKQHEQQGPEVVKSGEPVDEAASGAIDAAPDTSAPAMSETEDPDAAFAPKSPPPQQPEAQTSRPLSSSRATTLPVAQSDAFHRGARELVQTKCSTCHSLEVALAPPRSAAAWDETLEAMVGHGMVASQAERRLILDYLETCC